MARSRSNAQRNTSESMIEKLRVMFARYGVPMQLVSNNGSLFTSIEFTDFMKQNGIKHALVTPYHPRSNTQVELFVQTLKQYFKTEGSLSVMQSLARFLFSNRVAQSSATGQTSAELFLKHGKRTTLDLLHPSLGRKISDRQMYYKAEQDRKSKECEFSIREEVFVQNFQDEPKWLKVTIVEHKHPVSYKTQIGEQVWKPHVDQMCDKSYNHTPETSANAPKPLVPNKSYEMPKPEHSSEHSEVREIDREPGKSAYNSMSNSKRANASPTADQSNQPPQPARYRKLPSCLGYDGET